MINEISGIEFQTLPLRNIPHLSDQTQKRSGITSRHGILVHNQAFGLLNLQPPGACQSRTVEASMGSGKLIG